MEKKRRERREIKQRFPIIGVIIIGVRGYSYIRRSICFMCSSSSE